MKIIVGLGNPGDRYSLTKHNIGYMVVDMLAIKLGTIFKYENKFKAQMAQIVLNGEKVLLAKPETFMNLSGESIRSILDFYKLSNKDFLVVYDDVSMDVGAVRFRDKGSDGGHNGIKSVIQHLGTQEFDRMKIGIGPQPENMPLEAYVLQNFSKEQIENLKEVIEYSLDAISYYVDNDILKTQSKYNKKLFP